MKKPTPQEWIEHAERLREKNLEAWHEWAEHNQISRGVIQYVQDNPNVFGNDTATANPYIYTPPTNPTTTKE